MSETFLPQSFMFDFEATGSAAGIGSLADQSASGVMASSNPQFLKSEPPSPMYFNQNPHVQQQHPDPYSNDQENKQFDNFFTEMGTREISMAEMELQANNNNNNGSSLVGHDHCSWSHEGILTTNPAYLASPSSQHHQFVQSSKHLQNNPIQHVKKGRGGRKKSTR